MLRFLTPSLLQVAEEGDRHRSIHGISTQRTKNSNQLTLPTKTIARPKVCRYGLSRQSATAALIAAIRSAGVWGVSDWFGIWYFDVQ